MIVLLACAEVVAEGTPTDAGRYRIDARRTAEGIEVVLSDPRGRPIPDATVEVAVEGLPPGVHDPGECDAVGPDRCFHPGGRYLTRIALPDGPVVVQLAIDGPAGEDTATRRVRAPTPGR